MVKNGKEQKSKSAYDAYMESTEYEDIDSDIAYFSAKADSNKTRTRREAPASRSVAVPKKEHKPRKPAPKASEHEKESEKTDEREKKRKAKLAAKDYVNTLIASFAVAAIILLASLFTLASGDKLYSENENRYLAQRPAFTGSALADGSYMKGTESYLSDQFAGRNALVKARTMIDIFFGKKEINNVYIGKKHYLFEKPEAYEKARVEKTVAAINSLTKKYPKLDTTFALAPDASEVLAALMPKNAPTTNQQEQIKTIYTALDKRIKSVDICSTLKSYDNPQALYYRTDHHWTTEAAEIAFKQIAANMKLNTAKVDYQSYCVTNTFQGTLASSSGLFHAKDSIFITVPKTEVQYVVNNISANTKSASMFDSEKLKKKNQYEVFFGGNYGEVHIDTTLNSKKVLLVMKDSYANCLLPMLMPYYKSIIIIDPRYFKGNLDNVIKKESVTEVLWLYNVNTFLADTSISTVIK